MPPEESTPWPAEKIGRVASLIRIDRIALIEARANGIPEHSYDPSEYDTFWGVFVFTKDGMLNNSSSDDAIEIRGGIDVIVDFEYKDKETNESSELNGDTEVNREDPLKLAIEGTFLLQYGLKRDVPSDITVRPSDIIAFADFNATFNAWPYWREFVQSMSNRMNIPTIVVPLLPVPALDQ